MIRKLFCLVSLSLLSILPAWSAQPALPQESIKTKYFQLMMLFLGIFVVLMVWELIDWFQKKKLAASSEEATETVSVVEEESSENDPFRALLKEESVQFASSSRTKEVEHGAQEPPAVVEFAQEVSEPAVVHEERRDKPAKRVVHIDAAPEPAVLEPPLPQAKGEEKHAVMSAEAPPGGEGGWRDLMQKATQEPEERHAGKPTRKIRVEEEPPPHQEEAEEDDPWKALLKKSKTEDDVAKEEDKPWSVFLKSDKGKREAPSKAKGEAEDKAPPVEAAVVQEEEESPPEPSAPEREPSPLLQEKVSPPEESPSEPTPALSIAEEEAYQEKTEADEEREKADTGTVDEAASETPPEKEPEPEPEKAAEKPPEKEPEPEPEKVKTEALPRRKESEERAPTPAAAQEAEAPSPKKPLKKVISLAAQMPETGDKPPAGKDKKIIGLAVDKKKEDIAPEQKSPTKPESLPTGVKKAPKIISLDVQPDKGEDAPKKAQDAASQTRDDKFLAIEGALKKAKEKSEE
ncbi:MAG: hypothetical protein RDV48_04850 [Candidatus Eremiobacteraeota bacterium]|nr:hypothetical protein [Candidatus Eremiobacteraeota bacterium]